jgi:hypothetical protein
MVSFFIRDSFVSGLVICRFLTPLYTRSPYFFILNPANLHA